MFDAFTNIPNLHVHPLRKDSQINSRLESLPPELRLQILYQLDLEGLRALLHSSPVFHEHYLVNRKLLLHSGFIGIIEHG